MSDSDLQVTISVDASGASSGADQAKSAVASVAAQVQALSGVFGALSKDLSGGLDGLKKVSAAFEGLSKGAQHAQSAGGALKGLGEAISGLAGKAAAGGSGISRLDGQIASGLAESVAEGAGKLALLAEAASGVAGIALAVGQAAFVAGQATLEWAQHAQNSATATARQKANASALVTAWDGANDAAKRVGSAFDSVGASLASAFAPAVTAAINLMTGLANSFAESYASGGLMKTAVDLVSGAVGLVAQAIAATIDWWKLEIDVAGDFGRLASDAVKSVLTIVQDLGAKLLGELSPAFNTVQGDATTAWQGIQAGFDSLLRFIKLGYSDWKAANEPLIDAIRGIGAVFKTVEVVADGAMQSIIGSFGKLANAVLAFLEKLPGVSAAFQQLRDDLAATLNQVQVDLAHVSADIDAPRQLEPAGLAPPKGATLQVQTAPTPTSGRNQQGAAGDRDYDPADASASVKEATA